MPTHRSPWASSISAVMSWSREEALLLARAMDGEAVAVVAVQALLGPEPEQPLAVLQDLLDRRLRQAVLDRQAGESWGFGGRGDQPAGNRAERGGDHRGTERPGSPEFHDRGRNWTRLSRDLGSGR